jgi:hypothetical protein
MSNTSEVWARADAVRQARLAAEAATIEVEERLAREAAIRAAGGHQAFRRPANSPPPTPLPIPLLPSPSSSSSPLAFLLFPLSKSKTSLSFPLFSWRSVSH